MKIAIISNFYPPYYIGGYELFCQKVAEGLRRKGHQVFVATSYYGLKKPKIEDNIWRIFGPPILLHSAATFRDFLYTIVDFLRRCFFELRDSKKCAEFLSSINPDVIYLWNTKKIALSILEVCSKSRLPIFYYVFDHHLVEPGRWLNFWTKNNLIIRFLANCLNVAGIRTKPVQLKITSLHFATHFLKKATEHRSIKGAKIISSKVIYCGLETDKFPFCQENFNFPNQILFVGQIVRHKGVHTAIEAMDILINKKNRKEFNLAIIGPIVDKSYYLFLQKLIKKNNLVNKVKFVGQVEHKEMTNIYRNHGLLIFPSIWDEPFGITILEAMASGLVVIATGTGGSAEIVKDGKNALIFPKENAKKCAECILMAQNPELRYQLRQQARKDVENYFNFSKTINQINQDLQQITTYNS